MPQLGTSLTDDSRVVIYDHNMFIIEAIDVIIYSTLLTDVMLVGKMLDWQNDFAPKNSFKF